MPLVFCSKSTWEPPIRREHAWATLAAERGHEVSFVERPADVRALRGDRAAYVRSLWGGGPPRTVAAGISVRARSTILPGHRSSFDAITNAALLGTVLEKASGPESSIVFSWPWDWKAVRHAEARRRVFDLTDDWGEIMPGRRERFARYYEEIAAEADEIIVVNPGLAERFGGRAPLVIRNGVSEQTLLAPSLPSEAKTMIYVGTITPRFDGDLMLEVLRALPDWRLDLVGACQYQGLGEAPSEELKRLLDLGDRVRWHGPIARDAVLPMLDRAAVAIAPNRPEHSLGQDSMKFYDYAARGRPIVSTRWFDVVSTDHPPHLLLANTPREFARAVVDAAVQTEREAAERREWAAKHTWTERWPAWSSAVFGKQR